MSVAIAKVIADLEKKLQYEIDESAWLHRRFRDAERNVLNMKEMLSELREVETKL